MQFCRSVVASALRARAGFFRLHGHGVVRKSAYKEKRGRPTGRVPGPMPCWPIVMALALGAQSAAAQNTVTFAYEAEVTHVPTDLSSHFTVGDTFRFEFTFDQDTADSRPSEPSRGFYDGAITTGSVEVGAYAASASGGLLEVRNDGSEGDRFFVNALPLSGADLSGLSPMRVGLTFLDGSATVFDSIDLPSAAPVPADFSSFTNLSISFGTTSDPSTWSTVIATANVVVSSAEPSPKLYWTDSNLGTVHEANLDGSDAQTLISGLTNPRGVEVDASGGHLYFASGANVHRADLDGSNVVTLYALTGPRHLALDVAGNTLYWTEASAIYAAPMSGTGTPQQLIGSLSQAVDLELDLDGGKIYWAESGSGTVKRANVDGSGLETIASGLDFPSGIALDVGAGKVYWSDRLSSDIRRASLDGSSVETVVSVPNVQEVELDAGAGKLYWTNRADDAVQRANLDGSNVETLHQQTGDPFGLALASLVSGASIADLQVSLAPVVVQQQLVGDAVGYTASVHNAGPDAAHVELTVELPYPEQTEWGVVPAEAAINGIFVLDLGVLQPGDTEQVAFEVIYEAFGIHELTATVTGDHDESAPADNADAYAQQIDLSVAAAGVRTGGFALSGGHTLDGQPLAVAGIQVPGELIAGDHGFNLFILGDLTPGVLVPDEQFVSGDHFTPGGQFIPEDHIIRGDRFLPGESFLSGNPFVVGDHFISGSEVLAGQVFVPTTGEWDPAGRLLFSDETTDLLVVQRVDTTLTIDDGLMVRADGGIGQAEVALCDGEFRALLDDGDEVMFVCGSLTTTVVSGEVTIVLRDGTQVEVPAGSTAIITERGDGGYDISADGGPVTIILDDGLSVVVEDGVTAPDPSGDPDEDGLITVLEMALGTSPRMADSDADGLEDGVDPSSLALFVGALPSSSFATGGQGLQGALLSRLSDIEAMVTNGDLAGAAEELSSLRRHFDGCEEGAADDNDWVVECAAQDLLQRGADAMNLNLGS